MELADEFHLTTVEALEICDRLGIEAESLAADLSDDDAEAFRRGARTGLAAPGLPEPDAPAAPAPAAPAGPSLAKQLGLPAAAPPPPPAPPLPGPSAPDQPRVSFVGFGAPTPDASSPPPPAARIPKVPLRDRLPAPIADNLPVVIVGVVVLVALVAYVVASTSSTSPPQDPEELGLENASQLTIDDCIDIPEGASIDDFPELDLVPSKSCAEPHDIELYSEVRSYQGDIMERRGEYPGTQEILADTLSECVARFEKAIGTPYREAQFEVVALAPTGAMWVEASDRVSLCGVMALDGSKLEGSVKGATG